MELPHAGSRCVSGTTEVFPQPGKAHASSVFAGPPTERAHWLVVPSIDPSSAWLRWELAGREYPHDQTQHRPEGVASDRR